MTQTTQNKTAMTRPKKTRIRKLPIRDMRQSWKPQPCGISREDMRQIVLEMIG